MSGKLYKAIDVWSRRNGAIIRYRCFQVLPNESYCVQSVDFCRPPFEEEFQHDKQFLELLNENAPELRSPLFPSLTEAIEAFDRDFDAK